MLLRAFADSLMLRRFRGSGGGSRRWSIAGAGNFAGEANFADGVIGSGADADVAGNLAGVGRGGVATWAVGNCFASQTRPSISEGFSSDACFAGGAGVGIGVDVGICVDASAAIEPIAGLGTCFASGADVGVDVGVAVAAGIGSVLGADDGASADNGGGKAGAKARDGAGGAGVVGAGGAGVGAGDAGVVGAGGAGGMGVDGVVSVGTGAAVGTGGKEAIVNSASCLCNGGGGGNASDDGGNRSSDSGGSKTKYLPPTAQLLQPSLASGKLMVRQQGHRQNRLIFLLTTCVTILDRMMTPGG